MAKATVASERIINLALTEREAETLFLVTSRIGGPPTGRRGDMDSISDALDSVNIKKVKSMINGSIYLIGEESI